MKRITLILATILCVSVFSYGQQYEKIQNRWKKTFINLEHGAPASTEIAPGWHSAMWTIERDGSDLKFKNRWKNSYLLAHPNGAVATSELSGKSLAELKLFVRAIWQLERVKGTEYVRIKNKQSGGYLHIENGKLECSPIGPGAHSAMWQFTKVK
jgi:hypothetical protein